MNEKPLVSIIIPTKNSEETIAKCLESIKMQTYSNVEIIVVDNFSADYTEQIARKYGARVYKRGHERSSQVNLGVLKSSGKYIYRVDSDFILERMVVEEAVSMGECGYDAIAIHNTSDPTVSFWSKVRKLERDCYAEDELNIGARFLRREAFERIGGFDESLIFAEDYDLHNRLLDAGFKMGRIKAKEIHIGEPTALAEIARKHFYYGKTVRNFIKTNPRKALKQLSPIRPAYLRRWKDFLNQPTLLPGFVIYQLVRYLSSGLGYVAERLPERK